MKRDHGSMACYNQEFDSPILHHFTKEKAMKRQIEIRAAEGGEDSRLFVQDLAQAYIRLAQRVG